jgi:deoxyxylulose-5-phosphate synthase
MHEHFNRLLDSIRNERKRFETLVRETCIIVVLLGAGGKEIRKRRSIARKLKDSGIIALIPEDDFAPDVAPSLIEEFIFKHSDVDLVFLNVESWGSATELAQFYDDIRIAPKLRILTFHKYHPLYGSSKSYLSDLYLTHIAKYGHVYAYDDSKESAFPTSKKIILTLSISYKILRALGKV